MTVENKCKSSVWKQSTLRSSAGTGRCQLGQQRQRINQSFTAGLLCPVICKQINIICEEYLFLEKEMNHFCISSTHAVKYDQSHFCTCLSDMGSIQLWLEKWGMMLIMMGGEASSVPRLHFLTHAIIHNVRGRLVHVKYRA